MSQRLGSNINSPLFMSDPVPIRTNGTQSINNNNSDQSFLIKGDDSRSSSYHNGSSNDDVLIINSQGGSFQLHRQTLKETLNDLKSQANVSVKNLSPENTESFKSIVEALRLLYGSQALYDLVLNDIRDVFADIKDIKPGTVAAFFIGCFNDDKFPGPMGCSPKCAASLPPSEGTPGYNNCDDLVLIYSEGMFSSLNEKRSTHSYIYIEDYNFSGFTTDNLRQLREAGIENASLVYGNSDGSYREVTSPLTIDQLPAKSVQTTQNVTETSTTSNSGAAIAFAIILIAIIILLLVVLYRSRS